MRRWLIALATVLALGVTALAILYLFYLHPWLSSPDAHAPEIEQRWQTVEQLAEPGEVCFGDPVRIVAATRAMEMVDQDLRDAMARAEAWPPEVDHEELPPEFDQALMHLLQWHLEGGGLDVGELEQQVSLLDTFELGKAALASSASIERDLVDEAVLHLAWTYRECGQLVQGTVGTTLAEMAVEHAQRRGDPPTAAHRRYRPTPEQLLGIAAREALFTHELSRTGLALSGRQAPGSAPRIVPALVDPERELVMLRQYWGDRLSNAATDPSDTDLLVDQFASDDPDALPHSLLVRVIAPGSGQMFGQLAMATEEYEAFLGSAEPQER
jgi:hypothetical protein